MKQCPNCRALEGQPADIDPPPQMSGQAHHFQGHGVWERYRCKACGSEWERYIATKTLGAQSGSWKTLKALGTT